MTSFDDSAMAAGLSGETTNYTMHNGDAYSVLILQTKVEYYDYYWKTGFYESLIIQNHHSKSSMIKYENMKILKVLIIHYDLHSCLH